MLRALCTTVRNLALHLSITVARQLPIYTGFTHYSVKIMAYNIALKYVFYNNFSLKNERFDGKL